MKRVAYVVGGSLMFVLGLAACSSDSSTSSGAGATQGAGGGAGDSGNAGGNAGSGTAAGAGGSTGGSAGGGTNPFGGGGKSGASGKGGSSGGTGGGSTGTCQGGLQVKAGACGDCVNASCCTESQACQGEAECTGLLGCLAGCSDQACQQQCLMDNMAGQAPLQALNTCVSNSCKAECTGGSAGSGGSGGSQSQVCDSKVTFGDATCDMCLGTMGTCCADTKACTADATCKGCLTGMITDQAMCTANAAFAKMQTCLGTTCKTECGGGGGGTGICDSKVTTQNAGCDMCLGADAGCCGSFKACVGDATCKACLGMQMPGADCQANKNFTDINACITGTCKSACGG